MPQLYVLRRFSSWSFRLSAGVALLLSSAGLAAGLLASTATVPARGPQLTWRVAPAPAQAASELAAEERAAAQALPVSLSSMVPAYVLAVPAPASAETAPQTGAPEADSASTAGAIKATMQYSWHTFKLAFR